MFPTVERVLTDAGDNLVLRLVLVRPIIDLAQEIGNLQRRGIGLGSAYGIGGLARALQRQSVMYSVDKR